MINRSINARSPHYFESVQGRQFEFAEYALGDNPNAKHCIYAFCTEGRLGFRALYIGKANELKKQLTDHEKLSEARKLGATKLLVCQPCKAVVAATGRSELGLDEVETILVQETHPPLNVQTGERADTLQGAEARPGL